MHRLTDLEGNINDGIGNYSVGVKCSWLIDARDHNLYGSSREQKKPSIRLHLEEFATECGWDNLYLFVRYTFTTANILEVKTFSISNQKIFSNFCFEF